MQSPGFATSRIFRGILWASVAMALILAAGTLGYRYIGGPQYSWVDCFYMTFLTVSTIGFNEVVDLSGSPGGRLFTILIAALGIATMTYTLSNITAFILENDINQVWRRRKMRNAIGKLRDHYIVCGVGRVGSNVANELALTGRDYVIIDGDRQHLDTYLEKHPGQLHLHADATDNDVLLAAGVLHARGLFAVATDDSQNLVISLSAKQLNSKLRVVARCHDMKNAEKTRRAGADEIVSPDFTGGLRLVSAMLRPQVVSFLDEMLKTEDHLRMEEFAIPGVFSGKPLEVLNLDSEQYVVLGIRQNGQWTFNPDRRLPMHEHDVLMVMTTPQGRTRLEQLMLGVA